MRKIRSSGSTRWRLSFSARAEVTLRPKGFSSTRLVPSASPAWPRPLTIGSTADGGVARYITLWSWVSRASIGRMSVPSPQRWRSRDENRSHTSSSRVCRELVAIDFSVCTLKSASPRSASEYPMRLPCSGSSPSRSRL